MIHLLAVSLINIAFSIGLFFHKNKQLTRYLLIGLGLCLSIWTFALYMLSMPQTNVLLWGRILFIGPGLFPYILLLFILNYPEKRMTLSPIHYLLLSVLPLTLAVLSQTEFIVKEIGPNLTFVYNEGHKVFGLYFLTYFSTFLYFCVQGIRTYQGLQQLRLFYLIYGLSIPALWACFTNLVLPLMGNDALIFLGPASAPLFLLATLYSITHHRLIDIKVIISKSIATLLSLTIFCGTYLLLFNGLIQLNMFQNPKVQMISTLIYWSISATLFHWVHTRIQRRSDQTFLSKPYEFKSFMSGFSKKLASVTDLKELFDLLKTSFLDNIQASRIHIYFSEELKNSDTDSKDLQEYRLENDTLVTTNHKIPLNSALLQHFQTTHDILFKADCPDHLHPFLTLHDADICIPCMAADLPSCLIFIGPTLSKTSYTLEDFQLFSTLASQVILAIERIRPYERIRENYSKSLEIAEKASAQASFATLTRGIAHEIRNPMGMILSGTELIIDNIDNKTAVLDYAEMVKKNVIRLTDISNTMLRYGSPVSKKREWVNINSLLQDAIKLSKGECKKRQINLVSQLQNISEIRAEANSLSQAILNIILNAIEAIGNNGTITIQSKPNTFINKKGIEVSGIEINITDTGAGMDEKTIKAIYDPFFTTKYQNTGLGLSLVLKTIDEHHGIVVFQSQIGEGTTVTINLPKNTGLTDQETF